MIFLEKLNLICFLLVPLGGLLLGNTRVFSIQAPHWFI